MLLPSLLVANQALPEFWRAYALSTLARLIYYGRQDFVEAWARWSGADNISINFPTHERLSATCIMSSPGFAIVCFGGTRNAEQMILNIIGAAQVSDPFVPGMVSSFWDWGFRSWFPTLMAQMNLPDPDKRVLVTGTSMGAAIANITAAAMIQGNYCGVNGLITTAQPRTGNAAFNRNGIPQFERWVKESDPVVGVPLPSEFSLGRVDIPLFPMAQVSYQHAVDALILLDNGRFTTGPNPANSSLVIQGGAQIGQFINGSVKGLEENHYVRSYIDRLRLLAEGERLIPNLDALHEINRRCDQIDFNQAAPVIPSPPIPSPGVFANPRTRIPPDGSTPTPPPEDVGHYIEQRGVAHSFFVFGGLADMANTFKGHDRRLLQTLSKVCKDLIARDARVVDPKPTHTLSNRIIAFPLGGSPDLKTALAAVRTQADTLLANHG